MIINGYEISFNDDTKLSELKEKLIEDGRFRFMGDDNYYVLYDGCFLEDDDIVLPADAKLLIYPIIEGG